MAKKPKKRILAFCGAEQESELDFPKNAQEKLASGGRIYRDGSQHSERKNRSCDVTEITTGLIPVTNSKDFDPAVELYNQILADRARLLALTKKKTVGVGNIHLNFSYDTSLSDKAIWRTLSPTLSFLFGTSYNSVGYGTKGERFEICVGGLNTRESIVGGSAIAIAALTALKTGELNLEDFEYKATDNMIKGEHLRRHFDFNSEVANEGRHTVIITNKGEANLEEIFESTLTILEFLI